MSPLLVSYRSMTSRFPPFAFVELVSPYNKKNITRWLREMNFMFSWQEQYLTRSLCSLVRYCSSHSNIKFVSSRHRVISSIYVWTRGGPRPSEISCTYDPPIYDITSGCRVAALFSGKAQRWTPDTIWFPRYFYPQANGIMYLECREY